MLGGPADTRRFFWQAWHKHQTGAILEPLERIVVNVLTQHPEYHALFAGDEAQVSEFGLGRAPSDNPFLHLGLHVALHEQLQSGRPVGIREHYQRQKVATGGDLHLAEHRLIGVLADVLWHAQQRGDLPDENDYLAKLERLV